MIYVIFDIDGTLADTKKVEDKSFMKAFEETFGINIQDQKWEDIKHVTDWGITEEIILREMNRIPLESEYQTMIANFIANLEAELEKDKSQFNEVEGARNFFNHLRGIDEIYLGIATGSWEESALLKLDAIGLDMSGICFSNSNHHKSREDITKDVINQLKSKGNDPERIIYFGDGKWDFHTCKNLEIEFIGIDVNLDGKLEALGAKTIFSNYLNQLAILDKIMPN